MTSRSYLIRIALTVVLAAVCQPAHADVVVDLPEITVAGDGMNPTQGVLEVRLSLTASETLMLSAYSLKFTSDNPANVVFGAPTTSLTNPLFVSAGSAFTNSSTSQTVQVLHDLASALDPSLPAFNGAGLIRVPFTVTAGVFGQFALSFAAQSNEIVDAGGNSVAFTQLGGSINVISAVPEASGWQLLSLVASVAAIGVLIKRRGRVAVRQILPC
jgi:hypothetical protein